MDSVSALYPSPVALTTGLGRPAARIATVAILVTATMTVQSELSPPASREGEARDRPLEVRDQGYVSSAACKSCHPNNYATWHGSYHRTMTQLATPENAIAPFDGAELRAEAQSFRLRRRGRELFVEIHDPASQPPVTEKRIVLFTGSHHMQLYWFPSGHGRELSLLPFAYLRADARFVPRSAAFIKPPGSPEYWGLETGRWNTNCIHCHATQGRVSVTSKVADRESRVAEFGIACEACHGPAAEHVAWHNAHKSSEPGAPSMVDPSELGGRRSAEVCGQCHGITIEKTSAAFPVEELLARGHRFRPGADLEDTRVVARHGDQAVRDGLIKLSGSPTFWQDSFWSDGMVRVSGREHNGLVESPCARSPKFSCLSCHTLHPGKEDPRPIAEWADDQLAKGMEGDRACTQCHDKYDARDRRAAHTHHAPDSSGSRCANCHMPYTTYGLLKAIRSHQVSSPTVQASLATGRPNACNQCHLDRTLAWTADRLAAWTHAPRPTLTTEQSSIAASVSWLLRGDAGQRALMAWSYGWEAARQSSGSDWLAPYLAQLLVDPYDAVRYIAYRSLRRLPGFNAFRYDFVGPPADRERARRSVIEQWRRAGAAGPRLREAILIGRNGRLRQDLVARLLRQRDDHRVRLQE